MTGADIATDDARALARRFVDAFNARDTAALRALVTGDAEFRRTTGEPLRGPDAVAALVATAEDLDLRLVPLRGATVESRDGRVRVTLPVRELIGPDEIERVADFDVRDGLVAALAIRPLE